MMFQRLLRACQCLTLVLDDPRMSIWAAVKAAVSGGRVGVLAFSLVLLYDLLGLPRPVSDSSAGVRPPFLYFTNCGLCWVADTGLSFVVSQAIVTFSC